MAFLPCPHSHTAATCRLSSLHVSLLTPHIVMTPPVTISPVAAPELAQGGGRSGGEERGRTRKRLWAGSDILCSPFLRRENKLTFLTYTCVGVQKGLRKNGRRRRGARDRFVISLLEIIACLTSRFYLSQSAFFMSRDSSSRRASLRSIVYPRKHFENKKILSQYCMEF